MPTATPWCLSSGITNGTTPWERSSQRLIDAGLRIEYLHEHPFSVYGQLPFSDRTAQGYWHFPDGAKPIPLMYSIKASKPG